jgi:hypothetical protein
MKKSIKFLLCFLVFAHFSGAAQTYFFDAVMSKEVLMNYLSRSAYYNPAGSKEYYGWYNNYPYQSSEPMSNDLHNPCLRFEDVTLFSSIHPKYLSRAAFSWGGSDFADFTDEKNLADVLKGKVGGPTGIDPDIILEGFISEFIASNIKPGAGGISITIPSDIVTKYNLGSNIFDYKQMCYDDAFLPNGQPNPNAPLHVSIGNGIVTGITPDISKAMTQAWYYFLSTKLIDAGYEAIQWSRYGLLNDADPNNQKGYNVMTDIRTYAGTHARRHMVLITSSHGLHDKGNDQNLNANYPYFNYHPGGTAELLLFDFVIAPIAYSEWGAPVANSKNYFYTDNPANPRFERLVYINASTNETYQDILQFSGGKIPMLNATWANNNIISVSPFVAHLDLGGCAEASCPDEGTQTDSINSSYSFLTWGFGGESNYYAFTTFPYRNYLIHYTYNMLKQIHPDGRFMVPLLTSVGSKNYHFSNTPYNTAPYNYQTSSNSTILAKMRANNMDPMNTCYDPNKPTTYPTASGGCTAISSNYPCSKALSTESSPGGYLPEIYMNIENSIKEVWDNTLNINFCAPNSSMTTFTENDGYNSLETPRFMMDVNGDGNKDIVGINISKITVSLFNPTTHNFNQATDWTIVNPSNRITYDNGWRAANDTRTFGDFNGDGKMDLIGFGPGGTIVGIAGNNMFTFTVFTNNFGSNSPNGVWNNTNSVRLVGRIDGNIKDDVIAFGTAGVYTAISSGTSFLSPVLKISDFGSNQGYNNTNHIRLAVDLDNDLDKDILVFGQSWIFAAINNGSNFTITPILGDLCAAAGWSTVSNVRALSDVTGDGKPDIVAFGNEGVLVAKNTTTGTIPSFQSPEYWLYNFGSSTRANTWNDWTNDQSIRGLADVNGDGKQDIIVFGKKGFYVVPSSGKYFGNIFLYPDFGNNNGWSRQKHARFVTNIDNSDASSELICFGQAKVFFMNCTTGSFLVDPKDRDDLSESFEDTENEADNNQSEVMTSGYFVKPNPTTGWVEIYKTTNEPVQISLYNSLGILKKDVHEGSDNLMSFDISDQPIGIYFIRIKETSGKAQTIRIIKE